MKKTELAYLAGIFDGEGAIWIGRQKPKIQSPYTMLRVALGMANPYIPKLFHFAFGGFFNIIPPKEENKQPIWRWIATGRVAGEFLKTIKPYLRLKQSEANLALEFQSNKQHGAKKGVWGNKPKTEEELAVEEAQRILLKKMKVKSR